jgi:hypothetical protein
MTINGLLFEVELLKIESEANLILEKELPEGFKKATSKNPHPSAVNAWAARDGVDPKKVMALWDKIWEGSKVKNIAYNMPHFINAYKAIKGVDAGKVKTRVAPDNKTRTKTKKSIDDMLSDKKEPKGETPAAKKRRIEKTKKLTAQIKDLKSKPSTPTRKARIKKLMDQKKELTSKK